LACRRVNGLNRPFADLHRHNLRLRVSRALSYPELSYLIELIWFSLSARTSREGSHQPFDHRLVDAGPRDDVRDDWVTA